MIELSAPNESELSELRSMAGWYAVELAQYYPAGIKPQVMSADAWINRSTPNVLLIRWHHAVAGFLVVAVRPCIIGVSGNYLAEFYIKPAFRKSSTALRAGGLLMKQMPGEWTADVLALNEPSLRFSRAMTRRYAFRQSERPIVTEFGPFQRFRWEVR